MILPLIPLFFLQGCCCPGGGDDDEEPPPDDIDSPCCPNPIPSRLFANVSLCCCDSFDVEMNYNAALNRWEGTGGETTGECVSDENAPCDPAVEGVPIFVYMECNSEEGLWSFYYKCVDEDTHDLSINSADFQCDPVSIEFSNGDDSGESPNCCCECTGAVSISVTE